MWGVVEDSLRPPILHPHAMVLFRPWGRHTILELDAVGKAFHPTPYISVGMPFYTRHKVYMPTFPKH